VPLGHVNQAWKETERSNLVEIFYKAQLPKAQC